MHVSLSEQVSHIPSATVGHPDSQPLLTLLSSLKWLAAQVTEVHVSLSEQVSHTPSATVGHPASQPSVASPLASNLLSAQG